MDSKWMALIFVALFVAIAVVNCTIAYQSAMVERAAIEAGLVQETDDAGNIVWVKQER